MDIIIIGSNILSMSQTLATPLCQTTQHIG